mgnify:CR=1 FL=1
MMWLLAGLNAKSATFSSSPFSIKIGNRSCNFAFGSRVIIGINLNNTKTNIIQHELKIPITIVSVGPNRNQTLLRKQYA